MGSASKEILQNTQKFFSDLSNFLNPIGKLYLQIQILCRVLVVIVFLDDLFKDEPNLKCETKQVGCELVCVNRFAPISHNQLWKFELFLGMMSTTIFLIFNLLSKHQYRKIMKKEISETKKNSKLEKYNFLHKKHEIYSVYTTTGYIIMLVFRLCFEIICICLELSLAKHTSQNAKFSEIFDIKEQWICSVNGNYNRLAKAESTDLLLPPANRSELFYRYDVNEACQQQQVTVKCWIPLSRMKSVGLKFMFFVMIFQTILTFAELVFEVVKVICFPRKSRTGLIISMDSKEL